MSDSEWLDAMVVAKEIDNSRCAKCNNYKRWCDCEPEMIGVGSKLYGFCGGYFGRDSYSDKRVEAFGFDWVVAREDSGDVVFAGFTSSENLHELLSAYTIPVVD